MDSLQWIDKKNSYSRNKIFSNFNVVFLYISIVNVKKIQGEIFFLVVISTVYSIIGDIFQADLNFGQNSIQNAQKNSDPI
jgi:hypothetical protein